MVALLDLGEYLVNPDKIVSATTRPSQGGKDVVMITLEGKQEPLTVNMTKEEFVKIWDEAQRGGSAEKDPATFASRV